MLFPGETVDLKEYLFLKRMSVKDFSEFMGYSRTHISAIINGHLKPSKGLAKSIERATNGEVTAEDLLGSKSEKSEKNNFMK